MSNREPTSASAGDLSDREAASVAGIGEGEAMARQQHRQPGDEGRPAGAQWRQRHLGEIGAHERDLGQEWFGGKCICEQREVDVDEAGHRVCSRRQPVGGVHRLAVAEAEHVEWSEPDLENEVAVRLRAIEVILEHVVERLATIERRLPPTGTSG